MWRGGRDSNAFAENASETGKQGTLGVGAVGRDSRTGAKTSDSKPFAFVSRPFEQRVAELEAAIASVTRALGGVADEAVVMLVIERAAMRAELRAVREADAGNVVVLDPHHR
jgi:hypothetical protein